MESSQIFEVLTNDSTESRNSFKEEFESELQTLSVYIADAFVTLNNSDCSADESQRAGIVTAFLSLALESVVTSIQLLSSGHVAPSGNSMRISYESLCMAVLLKKTVKVKPARGTGPEFDFYKSYLDKSNKSKPHQIIDLMKKNAEICGLTEGNIEFLRVAKNFYNGMSHASHLYIHSRFNTKTGKIYLGGVYDSDRRDFFKSHIDFIIKYTSKLQAWVSAVGNNAT